MDSSFGAIFRLRVNIGSTIGNIQMNVAGLTRNNRYQINWNNTLVADSLFLTDAGGIGGVWNLAAARVTGLTQWYEYLYTPGTGNANYVSISTDWTYNGINNTQFGINDIASQSNIRLAGSSGNQIGVLPSYPTPGSFSDDNNIILQFTKTSASPEYVDITIYVAGLYNPDLSVGSWEVSINC